MRVSTLGSLVLLLGGTIVPGCVSPVEDTFPPPCEYFDCGQGRCEVESGNPVCICAEGHEPTGENGTCAPTPPSPCDPNPCVELNRTACTVSGGQAHCGCTAGYVDVSGTCVFDDPCEPNPCTEANRSVCTADGTSFICACDSGYELEEDSCVPVAVSCDAAHSEGDTYEPNECPSIALQVTGDLLDQQHTMVPSEDQDWFRVTTQVNRVYRFAAVGQEIQLALKVFAADGTTELESRSGASPEVLYRADFEGPVYIRIKATSPTATGSYRITLEDYGSDDHGESTAHATHVTPSPTAQSAAFHYPDDADYFAFDATADHIYSLSCTPAESTCALHLFDASGTQLVRPGTTPQDQWLAKFPAGRHYFRITSPGSQLGTYTYSLTDLGLDDHADVHAGAKVLVPAMPTTGRIEYWGDLDVLALDVTASHIYEVSCARDTDLTGDCNMTVRDTTDAVITAYTNGGDGAMRFRPTANGRVFVHVSTATERVGGYVITATNLGQDDYGDDALTAGTITYATSPTTQSGRLELEEDQDWFSVFLASPKKYSVRCTATGFDCALMLQDQAGNMVAQDSFGPDIIVTVSVGASQTYSLRVNQRFGTGGTGTYSLVIEEVVDDYGDDAASATPITLTGTLASGTGNIEVPGDVDVLALTPTAGKIYRFTCTPPGTQDCFLSVRSLAAFGTTLANDGNGGEGLILWKANTTDAVGLRITTRNTSTLSYSWSIEETTLTDDHGDIPSAATPVTFSSGIASGNAEFELSGDADVLSFSAVGGRYYRFTCTPLTATSCDLAFLNAQGETLAADSNGGTGSLLFDPPSTGTWYVRHAARFSNVGTYSWQIEETAITDDHGDDFASGSLVTFSAAVASGTAEIEADGDDDVFQFQATQGKIYELTCTPTGFTNCPIAILDSANQVLGNDFSSSGGWKIGWKAPSSATFALRVSGLSSSTGAYGWRIEELATTDDHADVVGPTATLMVADGTPALGNIDFSNDQDVFRVELTAGLDYDVTLTDGYTLSIYEPDGTSILHSNTQPSSTTPTVRTTGTHYVRIRQGFSATSNSYQLTLAP